MKPTFRLPDSSSRLGTGVFPSGNVVPSRDGGIFAGNAVPHREAIFPLRKCRPASGRRFFCREMQPRIGRPFFSSGNAVPHREAIFSTGRGRPESGRCFFTLVACRITVPVLSAAERLGWTLRLTLSKKVSRRAVRPACPIIYCFLFTITGPSITEFPEPSVVGVTSVPLSL